MLDAAEISRMSHDELAAATDKLRKQMDDVVSQMFLLHCASARIEGECIPDHVHLTEFMTVCAWQAFADSGQRGGDVRILLRDGSMPLYIARGMLSSAKDYLQRQLDACTCDCEEEEDG